MSIIIQKYFDEKSFTKIVTSFLFSKLFYAFEIWHYDLLNYNCKTKLNSFYYNCCRLILKDFEFNMSPDEINAKINRARPSEFANFCVARTVINSVQNNRSPLNQVIMSTSFEIQRRPGQLFFFFISRLRVGKNKINNRLTNLFNQIKCPWINVNRSQIRVLLKKTFFEYYK